MERLMPAYMSEPSQETECYMYVPSTRASRINEPFKLCDLSRNILIIICEFLSFQQIVTLVATNKRIKGKLDNFLEASSSHEVSYFKRRAIINFQSFFFEQFPSYEAFFLRMSSITSTCPNIPSLSSYSLGTYASSLCSSPSTYQSFLPLTKQSSLCVYSQKNLPNLKKQLSITCPFDLALDEQVSRKETRKQLLEKCEDHKPSNTNYIDETFKIWRGIYMKVLENKLSFIESVNADFYSIFIQYPEDFAKEMFQDPSLSENPSFTLPQLQRENFAKKGQFYRTEKILVQSFQSYFRKYSVDGAKQKLWDLNDSIQSQYHTNDGLKIMIQQLLSGSGAANTTKEDLGISQTTTMTASTAASTMNPITNRSSSLHYPFQMASETVSQQDDEEDFSNTCKSRSDLLMSFMPDPIDVTNLDDCSDLGFALQNLQMSDKGFQAKNNIFDQPFEPIGESQGKKDSLSSIYLDVSSYTLRQFQLLCNAHHQQLDFILQQIQMAPPQKQDLYIYLEDYILKEKNLRFLLKRIPQIYAVSESFRETLLKQGIINDQQIKSEPYVAEFILLELMDSIWMNETYRRQGDNLIEILKKQISHVHHLDKIGELGEKKETFRKLINLVHQMEFNLENESAFLKATNSVTPSAKLVKSDIKGTGAKRYEDLELHIQKTVKGMLKTMQRCSQTVAEFIGYCEQYESFEFHIIQELEYFYILMKKHYLSKAFCKEFQIKLDNNKYHKGQSNSGCSSPQAHLSAYKDLNLCQILPPELRDSFFQQLVKNLYKEQGFKEFMETDQLMQSLFMLFHIESQSKYQFALSMNQLMLDYHMQLDDLQKQYPELYGLREDTEEEKGEQQSFDSKGNVVYSGQINCSRSDQNSQQDGCGGGPFTIFGSDEDEDMLDMELPPNAPPELCRGYSDQKRQYQKAFKAILFAVFRRTEDEYNFREQVKKKRELDHKQHVQALEAQINQFNLNSLNMQQQRQQQVQQNNAVLSTTNAVITAPEANQGNQHLQQPIQTQQNQPSSFPSSTFSISPSQTGQNGLQGLPDLDDFEFEMEDLPDPSFLMSSFNIGSRQQSQIHSNENTMTSDVYSSTGFNYMGTGAFDKLQNSSGPFMKQEKDKSSSTSFGNQQMSSNFGNVFPQFEKPMPQQPWESAELYEMPSLSKQNPSQMIPSSSLYITRSAPTGQQFDSFNGQFHIPTSSHHHPEEENDEMLRKEEYDRFKGLSDIFAYSHEKQLKDEEHQL